MDHYKREQEKVCRKKDEQIKSLEKQNEALTRNILSLGDDNRKYQRLRDEALERLNE